MESRRRGALTLIAFLIRRIAQALLVLWIVVTLTFLLMHLVPGGPFDRERAVPTAVRAAIEARYRLNDPLWRQYLDYLKGLAGLDLGPSFYSQGRSVNSIIANGFPVSALLGGLSILLSICVGIPLGIVSAMKRNRLADHAAMTAAIALVSVPSFVLCSFLIFVLAGKFLPEVLRLPATWSGAALPGESLTMRDRIMPLIIPVISLSAFSLAYIARLSRASFIEVMQQDYIRTAKAKGASTSRVIFRHAMRNAITPVATYLGPLVAMVLTGSFVIERIYNIPGLGRHFVTSIYNRDYPVILGVTVFYCSFLVAMNVLVDVIYVWLDPRVRVNK